MKQKIKHKKRKARKVASCIECQSQADCCRMGAWIDLEEAKQIISLGIKGDFFHLEKDNTFPSGYKVGTSYEDDPCSFLRADGLCAVHKVDYKFKPQSCREFPYEDDKVSSFAKILCTPYKSKIKKRKSSIIKEER